jgi:hypothetical protein
LQQIPQIREISSSGIFYQIQLKPEISFDTPVAPVRSINFPAITTADIRKAILKAGNTAPGQDEISTAILRAAWPVIEPLVLNLFQGCLSTGYHPTIFRSATLAIIPKPNKPDQTSPRAYWPIALLSVLGKGLERLLARNISRLAINLRVLSDQQFGALPLRSSVDLTTCLTHDIETALNCWNMAINTHASVSVQASTVTVYISRIHTHLDSSPLDPINSINHLRLSSTLNFRPHS